jgi:CYTH domain-containing protein
MKEIERKFFIKKMPDISNIEPIYLEQCYIMDLPETRVRKETYKNETKYYLIVKSEGDISRDEDDVEISKVVFDELKQKQLGVTLYKNRYKIPVNTSDIAEVDLFDNKFKNLTDHKTVEVEFKSDELAENFIIPDWFGEEITYDKRYKNKNLSLNDGI